MTPEPRRPGPPGDPHATADPAPPAPRPIEATLDPPSTADAASTFPPGGPPGLDDEGTSTVTILTPSTAPGSLGRLGRYEILDEIGDRGAMGTVFRAYDPDFDRVVAIKAMKPDLMASPAARKRFADEIRAIAKVEHENVLAVYDCGVSSSGKVPFMVMPLVTGGSLKARLERDGPPPLAEILRVGREVALGLAAAHARGVIHRDVKPANILLDGAHGRVKLADFGLARFHDEASLSASSLVGTPAFMAPEQANGRADWRSDLWSLGAVLYNLSTGTVPFAGSTVIEVLYLACTQPHLPLIARDPSAHPGLSWLVDCLLSKDPAGRPPHAAEVAHYLDRFEREPYLPPPIPSPPPPPPPSPPSPPPPHPTTFPWWIVTASLTLAGLAMLAVSAWLLFAR